MTLREPSLMIAMSSSWIRLAQIFSVICLLAVVCYQWLSRRPSRRRSDSGTGDGGSSGDWFGSDSAGHHAHSGGWDTGSGSDSGGGGDGGGGGGD